jgi:hypothetical protein
MAGRLGGDESGGVYFGPPAEPFPGTDAAAKVQEAAEAAIRYDTQHTHTHTQHTTHTTATDGWMEIIDRRNGGLSGAHAVPVCLIFMLLLL